MQEALAQLQSGVLATFFKQQCTLTIGSGSACFVRKTTGTMGPGQLASGAGSSTLASGTQALKSGTADTCHLEWELCLSGADKLKDASGQVQEGISKLAVKVQRL